MTPPAPRLVALAALAAALAACGSSPQTRYYQLAMPGEEAEQSGQAILAVEQLVADAAYAEPRIVYRESPYRLDYYHYHRWSAPPGVMVSDYLRMAYRQSGRFRAVVSGYTPDATAILTGRIMALEEVDVADGEWLARVRLELHLRDARTGDLLWSTTATEEEPLRSRTPEGLAQSLSDAMGRIVAETAPAIAEVAANPGT